jgi:hypothetical protein
MEFKQITIMGSTNDSNTETKKEDKMRIQTHTWEIDDGDLSHDIQTTILNYICIHSHDDDIYNCENNDEFFRFIESKYINIFINNLKNKISSYKQQDILKKRFNKDNFTNFDNVVNLLNDSCLKCHYCKKEIFILYKRVKEMSQWTLDRIDNNLGHNIDNLVISCLKCNLKRRRINKNSFLIAKNMTVKKNDYDYEENKFEDSFKYDKSQTKIVHIDYSEEMKKI